MLVLMSNSSALQPPASPVMPSQQVVISGKAVELPNLPESVQAAKKEFGSLSVGMKEGLKDLEHTLEGLYASPDAGITLPGTFRIEKKQGEDLRFLVSMVNGDAYRELEGPCVQAWEEWQGALVRNGLAHPAQAVAPNSQPSQAQLTEDKEIRKRQRGMQKTERAVEKERAQVVEMMSVPAGESADDKTLSNVAWVMGQRATTEAGIAQIQLTAHLADQHAPSLAKLWLPLATRLNADALHLASSELGAKPSAAPEFRALRTQARIQFLERYRSALWFSLCVWSRMAGQQLPASLRELNPILPDPTPAAEHLLPSRIPPGSSSAGSPTRNGGPN